jgi:ABC-type bacteriocin/lantibiotic exporter with double-glycine peptidase domain
MTKKHPFRRLSQLLGAYRKEVVSIYLFSALSGLVNLSLPLGVQTIIGLVMGATMVTSIYVLIFFVVLGVLLVGILQMNQMKIIESIQQKLFTSYAFDFAERIPQIDLKQSDGYFMPEKITRFFETLNIQKGFSKLLLDIPIASVQIILGIILLSLYHPLYLALGIVLLVILGLILGLTSQSGIQTSIEESNYKYEVTGFFGELARTLKSFKFSRGSELTLSRTDKNVLGYIQSRTKHFQVLLLQYRALIFFKVSLTILMLTLGTYLLINQQLNIGEFIAAEIVILMIISAVEKLITSMDSAYDVLTGLEKIASVIEIPLETSGDLTMKTDKGISIQMQHFKFEFEPGKALLNDLNLHIESGDKVQIQGEEGAGKTLFLRMLTGNYADFMGNLLVNKVPIQNYDIQSLRQHTGVLLHGQEIFGGTILENIQLGQAEITPKLILETATNLGIDDFISYFPKGFQTQIEPIGKKTPQTWVKKILLLRALCGEKRLLLLEDPWAGIDEQTGEKISQYLHALGDACTVVVISNKLHPAFKPSKTLTFHNGKI